MPAETWLTLEDLQASLRTAAEKKRKPKKDHYRPDTRLLVYFNPGFVKPRQEEVEGILADATDAVRDRFNEVWVLWEGRAYNTWQAGNRGSRVLRSHVGEEEQKEVASARSPSRSPPD